MACSHSHTFPTQVLPSLLPSLTWLLSEKLHLGGGYELPDSTAWDEKTTEYQKSLWHQQTLH